MSFGQVPARYLQLHLHQEDSVMVGEDLVYSLFATPLIVFGALSGLWPLASGQRRLISGTCSYYWRRRIQYTSRLVFAFFDSITEGRRSPSLSATSKHTWITQAYVMDAFFWSFLVFVATSKYV